MKTNRQSIAIAELFLILPAMLFMSALFLRQVQPVLAFGRIVTWFAQHFVIGLGLFLVVMPLAACVVGCGVLLRSWHRDSEFRSATSQLLGLLRAQWPIVVIAGTTLVAAAVLLLVGLHMITE